MNLNELKLMNFCHKVLFFLIGKDIEIAGVAKMTIHFYLGVSAVTVLLSSTWNILIVVQRPETRNQRNGLNRHTSITLP